MKYLFFAFLAVTCIATVFAGTNIVPDARSRELIRSLHLMILPKESGYLGVIGVSSQHIALGGHSMAVQSQNYYLLNVDRPIHYLHWLASDDTDVLIEGGPVDYFIFYPDGHAEKFVLGRNLSAGQVPVIAIPGGCWKALRLHPGATYALMANLLSPEYTTDRVKVGAGPDWVERYTRAAPWATTAKLRELIGPNYTPE